MNPTGHRTAYLWEQVWERESWLEILGRYLIAQRDSKKQIEKLIFPRYHQLDATRKLVAAVLAEGPGGKYLIQHSAGSGKTNSIAWTAHFFADLHDARPTRRSSTPCWWSPTAPCSTPSSRRPSSTSSAPPGVVAMVTGKSGSKSGELAEALSGGKKIVVCTIQTFPFALEAVRELAATEGKRFAVIADEAHSSQSGEAAAKLKEVLSAEELAELDDGGEVSTEDILAAQMAPPGARGPRHHLRGLHRHAQGQDPGDSSAAAPTRASRRSDQPARSLPRLLHAPGHRGGLHPRRAARTTPPTSSPSGSPRWGREWDEQEVDRNEALKGIMRWVRLHPYNIAQKVQIVVEHFRENVAPLLDGQAKAMVVVGSRVEAVRWQLAIDKYIRDRGYPIGTLVAFSGEVTDKESGPDSFSEHSKALNPGLKGATSARPSPRRSTRSCWSPTSSRPASTSPCCAACTWTSGWPASRRCRPSRA